MTTRQHDSLMLTSDPTPRTTHSVKSAATHWRRVRTSTQANTYCATDGTICDCCDEKAWDEDITIMADKSMGYTTDMNVCKHCIEELEPDEIVPLADSPSVLARA